MEGKSIKKNAILNAIKVLMTIVFPLITFPYATRVLGTENIGKVQFGTSVIVFFMLFAALGINNYAVREGASYRDNRKKISKFASEVFSINILFTIISYIVLFVVMLLPTKLNNYMVLLLIQSIQILFTTIGVDWVYTIYEDYFYITIRSIIVQVISLVLLFIFIHKPEDYYLYAAITVIANSGVNILNFIHSKKYVDLKFRLHKSFDIHIKPMLVLFSNDLAQQVYINSDSLMLGFITSDYYVGIYSVSVKIYTVIKKLLNAIIAVTIPRMAYYNSNNKKEFTQLCSKIFKASMLALFPVMALLFLLSDRIILFLFGNEFLAASLGIKILSIGLLFAVFANIFCNGILIVKKQEKHVLNATLIAAAVNFALNIVFINLWKQNGAAITTVIAEFIVMIYSYSKSKRYISFKGIKYELLTECIGCLGIGIIYYVCNNFLHFNDLIFMGIVVSTGLLVYVLILLIMRNKMLLYFMNILRRKIGRR